MGEAALAIGNPLPVGQTVTLGVIAVASVPAHAQRGDGGGAHGTADSDGQAPCGAPGITLKAIIAEPDGTFATRSDGSCPRTH